MRLGLWLDDAGRTFDEMSGLLRTADRAGFATAWLGERGLWDPLTAFAALGASAPRIGLGTSIVRTYPRHPLALAAQALTVQAATGNRLTLGLGPGPGPVLAGQYGYSADRPVANLREYLGVLRPLLRGESVAVDGAEWSATGRVTVPGAEPPAIVISALGPVMLHLAGEAADGTITAWMGPRSIEDYVLPRLAAGAAAAGREVPAVIAGLCVSVTNDADAVRARIDGLYGAAVELPSYRAVFEREGLSTPSQTAAVGDEATVAAAVRRFADSGVAELQVIVCGSAEEQRRTAEFVAQLDSHD